MTLQVGTRLGPYEITAEIGAGGMGIVYRARDTRLKRDVAIKVLPETFLHDQDRAARFQREAELLATLNHPNIAAIYGFEQSDSVQALVLELIEGPTLADAIVRMAGPSGHAGLPLDEALPIARQIAEALESAHERGVIHRDLKPANVKVTPDGQVKVLDFGLAKLAAPADVAANPANTMAPTLSVQATLAGMILGTAAYMSPEQARAKPVDKRTDVWAFGCVLYEMLTGTRAFDGEEVTDILARVIEREPDFAALPASTPPVIRKLLRRCLERDRKRRLPDIGVARLDIEEALTTPSIDGGAAPAPDARIGVGLRGRVLPWSVAVGAVLVAGAAVALWAPWQAPAPAAPQHLSVELGADVSLMTDQGAAAVLSPDGRTLAFVAQQTEGALPAGGTTRLYVRRLDQLQAAVFAQTEGARDPFFSPDGQWIGFFAGGKLKKIATSGGAAVTLADAPNGRGAAWTGNDTIIFQPFSIAEPSNGPLLEVSAAGGTPQRLTELVDNEVTHRWPQALPGGSAILFTAHSTTAAGYEGAHIVVQALPAGARKVLQRGGYYARYVSSGHIVYMHEGTLFAAPFDLDRLELTGQPVPALENVTTNPAFGGVQFAVAESGTLVYLPGGRRPGNMVPIAWMDRQGKTTTLRATPADWSNPQFSPDGRLLAIDIGDGQGTINVTDVWVYDWARDTLSRLTFDAADDIKPVWTPDGRRIVFSSRRGDKSTFNLNLYWQRADGSGDVQRLTESKNGQVAGSWHPSGRFLAFTDRTSQINNDVMILPMEGNEASGWKPAKPTVFLGTPASEFEPMFSPDGRWLAYVSNESGALEIYVRRFPGPGGKWQISTGGGMMPTWSRTRPELFYRAPDGRIMVASYTADGDSFRADKPSLVTETRTAIRPGDRVYTLHPDGQRFAVAPPPEEIATRQDKVVFVFNFFDELRRIAPVN